MKTKNKALPLIALLITIVILAAVLFISSNLEQRRQSTIDSGMQQLYMSLNEMQTFSLMAENYDQKMACIAYTEKLHTLDKNTWELGQKIDQYRIASEEFAKDPYYLEQKRLFNENEMLYLMLLQKVKSECANQQPIVMFFYQNSEDCKKCDDQSFILTDIKKADESVAIFSFDTDLDITTVKLLTQYYEIEDFPCVVINDAAYCGIQDKNFIIEKICKGSPESALCDEAQ